MHLELLALSVYLPELAEWPATAIPALPASFVMEMSIRAFFDLDDLGSLYR